MTMTGLEAFDSTIQETNLWLKEVGERLHYENRNDCYSALRAVLFALRDRLTLEEAIHLGDQMPLLVRGIFFEGWKPGYNPGRERSADEFIGRVQSYLRYDIRMDARRIIPAVFQVLARKVSSGEIEDVLSQLPAEIKELMH